MPDVQVLNRNTFQLKGRFGGKDYVFPPGEPVTIPEKAAEHIFALAEERENKTGALNRLGLLSKPTDTLERAFAALDRVTLREGYTVFKEPKPLPPPPRGRPPKAETPKPEPEPEEEEDEPAEEEEEIGDSPSAPRNPGGESEAEVLETSVADALDMDALAQEVLARRRKHGGT